MRSWVNLYAERMSRGVKLKYVAIHTKGENLVLLFVMNMAPSRCFGGLETHLDSSFTTALEREV